MKLPTCKRPKFLKGGISEKINVKDIDKEILALGIKTEMEHTTSRCVAMHIALDHIAEHGEGYYDALIKMEKRLN